MISIVEPGLLKLGGLTILKFVGEKGLTGMTRLCVIRIPLRSWFGVLDNWYWCLNIINVQIHFIKFILTLTFSNCNIIKRSLKVL